MNHYIDNAVSSSGNGSSWSQAWKGFSVIDWDIVEPGDTIYISGGSGTKTYTEQLKVGASGTEAAKITITEGIDPGHDGQVILDGGNSLSYGVLLNSRDHVTVSDLDVRDFVGAGFRVTNVTAGVTIEDNAVHAGDPGSGNARGYDVRNSSGVTVTGNSFTTPTNTEAQTDGIWSSDNDGVVFEKNEIVISNNSTTGHSDGIQSFHDINITVRYNRFEQANAAETDNHGAWLSNTRDGGVLEVYDNVFLAPNLTGDANVTHIRQNGWTQNGTAEIYNNNIVGGREALAIKNSPDVEAYDNITIDSDTYTPGLLEPLI